MGWFADLLAAISSGIEHHATAWWVFPAVFCLAALDGLVPPLPAESVVIALSAYTAAGAGPDPFLLAAVACVGGIAGDNLCYTLGRHSRLSRLRDSKRDRLRRAFRWAERELEKRGGMLIFVGRYIPVGRMAVNVAAGATQFPRRRFLAYDVPACLTWAAYAVVIGYFFGTLFDRRPLLGSAVGIAGALVLGWLIDRAVQRWFGSPDPAAQAEDRDAH